MSTIITRTWFCPTCYEAGRPHSGQPYVAHGSTRNDFLVKIARGNGTPGFCPHVLRIRQSTPTHIIYDYFCGICGVEIIKCDEYEECYDFRITQFTWQTDIMKIAEWNHWTQYKFDRDYWI